MQTALQSDCLVLESDPIRRKQYLQFPKRLFLSVCPVCLLISIFVLYLTKDSQWLLAIRLLRQLALFLSSVSLFSCIPLLIYWANCAGTSLVQRLYLSQDRLCYTGYNGSLEERVEFTFTLKHLTSYRIGKRAIRIQGQFTKTTKDVYGFYRKGPFSKTLWIPRTFPLEQEQALLQFLDNAR